MTVNNVGGFTPEQEKVLNRIKKMLALAADSAASEGERDNALRMAHSALSKHNLSMSHVAQVGIVRQDETMVTKGSEWPVTVAAGIGHLFFCVYYRHSRPDGSTEHHFIGQTANVMTAVSMTEYVIRSILKEAKTQVSASAVDALIDGGIKPEKDFQLSFKEGAAVAVRAKCELLRKQAEEESRATTTGTDIVLASYYDQERNANNAWLNAKGVFLGSRPVKFNGGSAFNQGRAYGESINLSKQVGSKGGALRLGHKK